MKSADDPLQYPPSAGEIPSVTESRRPRVSLCMIVKNEAHNLPTMLDGLSALFDEIVIVDTGSTDGTPEIAAKFGAAVSHFDWVDSFSAARNASFDRATGDWLFWLDADDRLPPLARQQIADLFTRLPEGNHAYILRYVCAASPGNAPTVVDHPRLFRNRPDHRWRYRIHEQILPSLRESGATLHPTAIEITHLGYADEPLRRQKLHRDLRILQMQAQDDPNDPLTLFYLGAINHSLGNVAEAAPWLVKCLERSNPTDPKACKSFVLLADCQRQAGQLAAALNICRQGRQYHPRDVELAFWEGIIHHALGHMHEAERCWREALSYPLGERFVGIDTGFASKARFNLGVLLLAQNRLAELEPLLLELVHSDPAFPQGPAMLAELYLRQGRWNDANTLVAQVAEQSGPHAPETHFLRGRVLLGQNRIDDALASFAHAERSAPRDLHLRMLKSEAYLKANRHLEAIAALRAVLELDPNNSIAQHNLRVTEAKLNAG